MQVVGNTRNLSAINAGLIYDVCKLLRKTLYYLMKYCSTNFLREASWFCVFFSLRVKTDGCCRACGRLVSIDPGGQQMKSQKQYDQEEQLIIFWSNW